MKCLMIAFAFILPYHVLRTAAAAGHKVHVLGRGQSRGLRWSRYCASYRICRDTAGGSPEDALLADIRQAVGDHDIDVIMPSDDVSTRLLAGLRDQLPAPTSLLPDVASFELLNDKWRFTRFCLEHGVRVPQGWCFPDLAALQRALGDGTLRLPVTAKPLSRSAGIGVVHLRKPADLPLLDAIDYRPIVVQRYIHGETVGFNVICRDGEILTHVTQRRDEHRFELFANRDLLANIARLVAITRYSGPANFDAILEDGTGFSYIVECNPRFWFTIYLSMILGVNFVDLALRGCAAGPSPRGQVCMSLGDILRNWRRATRFDRAMLYYHLGDPLPLWFQRRHVFDDSEVYLPPAQMTACSAARQMSGTNPGESRREACVKESGAGLLAH